jgi:hypothetical protein
MDKFAVEIGNEFFGGSHFLRNFPGIGQLVSIILSNAVAIAAVIMFLLLIFGGFSIIIAAGRSDPEQAAKGKQAATAAVIGFIIIFASYWIIQIIEITTGLNILTT